MKQYKKRLMINIKQLLPISYLYSKKYKKEKYFLLFFDFVIWMIPFALISTLFLINLYKIIKKEK